MAFVLPTEKPVNLDQILVIREELKVLHASSGIRPRIQIGRLSFSIKRRVHVRELVQCDRTR